MDKAWTVFGGWAIGPDILRPVFGPNATYIDVNLLAPLLIDKSGLLAPDWPARVLRNLIQNGVCSATLLAGWSMGAIVAQGIADHVQARERILFSATESFSRRGARTLGVKPLVLQTMRSRLPSDGTSVVGEFYARCGLAGPESLSALPYSVEQLHAGLSFLEQVQLDLRHSPGCSLTVCHGTRDAIIPCEAGRLFSQKLGGRFVPHDGPHAFFVKKDFRLDALLINREIP